jgi:hypothetical protein
VNTANPVTINGITYSLANPFGFASPIVPSGSIGGLGLSSLAGWYGAVSATATLGARFGATYGDQTTGGILSFGLPSSGRRALGLLATSSTGFTSFGAKLVNDTDQTLHYLTLQITGEVWRQSDLPKTLQFYYWIDPTALGDFPTTPASLLPGLDVRFPTVPAAIGGVPVDGTSLVNQTNLGVVNQPVNWPPGAALWLVWKMADPAARSQGLAIDNFVFMASVAPQLTPVPLTVAASGTNVTFTWPTFVGQLYQPEYLDDLGSAAWLPLGNPVPGTGRPIDLILTNDFGASQRFLRLRLLPQ